MRFEDERYIRFYTRDTVGWLLLSLEAQGLFGLLLRKVDRAGLLPLGRHGKRAVAVAIGHPTRAATIEPALDELLADGCVRIDGDVLVIPNFIEAQEAPASDAQRQRESRARARDLAAAAERGVTKRSGESRNVTKPSRLASLAVPPDPSELATRATTAAREQPDEDDPLPDFRRCFAAEMARTDLPRLAKGRLAPMLREHIDRLGGPEDAADVCAEACRERGVNPDTIDYVATFIAELEPPPPSRAAGENPKPGDEDFNDAAAWPDYGDFLKRDSGRPKMPRPKYVKPLTPAEEAAAAAAAAKLNGAGK